jgi:prepilin-type processing-associated H-X9-DG protein
MVVIAILCLLIAILLPSFGRAKQAARRMICISHMSGVGNGVSGYVANNQGVLPPPSATMAPAANNGGAITYHSWAQTGWNSWGWRWSDFIVNYFDTEAHPPTCMDDDCTHIGVDDQPFSGNYYEDEHDGHGGVAAGVVMSKHLRCPDQPLTGLPDYPDSCGIDNGSNGAKYAGVDHRYDRHYMYTGSACDGQGEVFWSGGDFWTIPSDGQVHTNQPPEIQPVRPIVFSLSNFTPDRQILVLEPYFYYSTLNYIQYATDFFNHLPHEDRGDTAGNFCFMDGHVETLTRTFIYNWCCNARYSGAPSSMVPTGPFVGYPFK